MTTTYLRQSIRTGECDRICVSQLITRLTAGVNITLCKAVNNWNNWLNTPVHTLEQLEQLAYFYSYDPWPKKKSYSPDLYCLKLAKGMRTGDQWCAQNDTNSTFLDWVCYRKKLDPRLEVEDSDTPTIRLRRRPPIRMNKIRQLPQTTTLANCLV